MRDFTFEAEGIFLLFCTGNGPALSFLQQNSCLIPSLMRGFANCPLLTAPDFGLPRSSDILSDCRASFSL